MKNNKNFIIVLCVILGIAALGLLLIITNEKIKQNKCFSLDIEKDNFIELVDRCYLSGAINKERKDYLTEKHADYALQNRQAVVIGDKVIKFTAIEMYPGNPQYSLNLDSNYCNKEHDYCNGCTLNFFNLRYPEDKTVIFSQETKNSGMNFINKSNIDSLDEDFCFNLDCGDYESEDICTTKSSINKKNN